MRKSILNKNELFILSANELSLKFNTTLSAVYHARKHYLNPTIKVNNYATDYLSIIDNPNKAYILGLFVADSSVSKYYIHLTLHSKDRDILEKVHDHLKLTTPIIDRVIKKRGDDRLYHQSTLAIYSKTLCETILKYGLMPNKTHKTFFPEIDPSLYSHFIRGYFDGDGCIHVDKENNLHIKIVGNLEIITRIQEILVDSCGISNTKIMNCKNSKLNIVNLQHGGNLKCIKILDYLYKDANMYINRKYEIYKKFKQIP